MTFTVLPLYTRVSTQNGTVQKFLHNSVAWQTDWLTHHATSSLVAIGRIMHAAHVALKIKCYETTAARYSLLIWILQSFRVISAPRVTHAIAIAICVSLCLYVRLSVRHTSEPHQNGRRYRSWVCTIRHDTVWGFFTPTFVVVCLGVPPQTNVLNRHTQPISCKNLTNNLRYLKNGARYDASLYQSISQSINIFYFRQQGP